MSATGGCEYGGRWKDTEKVDRIRKFNVIKKILIIVTLGIVALIVGIVMRKAAYQRDPSLQPPADVKNIGLVQPSVACAKIQDHLKDKKLSKLTAMESELLENCKAMGY
jgi:hypothetical protein